MDFELIARLHSEGLADGEIAKAASTHHVVIRYWRNQNGLAANAPRPKPPAIVGIRTWTDERDELITKLWQEGLSASEIAKRIDRSVTRNAVIGRLHRLGVTRRMKQVSKQTRNRITVGRMLGNIKRTREAMKPNVSPVRELLRDLPTEPLPPTDTMAPTLSWAELEDQTHNITQCRAVLPADGDKTICGRETVAGTSWCECHLRRYATPVFVKKTHPDRPAWQDNRTGSKGAVFMSGREKMKAY